MLKIDKISELVTVSPEVLYTDYEEGLKAYGLTSGYFPVTDKLVSLAQCLSERIPNHLFLKYGGLEDLCVGGNVLLPGKKEFVIKTAPRSATGPDLRKMIIGAQNDCGFFENVVLRVFPLPERELWGVLSVPSKKEAKSFLAKMMGVFIFPALVFYIEKRGRFLFHFKLSGAWPVVEAEKDSLILACPKNADLSWVETTGEPGKLETENINKESFNRFLEVFSPLVGEKIAGQSLAQKKLSDHLKKVL